MTLPLIITGLVICAGILIWMARTIGRAKEADAMEQVNDDARKAVKARELIDAMDDAAVRDALHKRVPPGR